MSVKIKNSLSNYLEHAMILEKNSIESIQRMHEAVTTGKDSVTLTITDPASGETQTYNIPSFKRLKDDITRLEQTVNTITNLDGNGRSNIRLSDGSYRKIILSSVPTEAPTITSVNGVTNFSFKSNWFFEDMLNPCLYITLDLTNKIKANTERVMIQRYMLNCDTQKKIDAFEDNLKGNNEINYKEFLNFLINNNIRYTLDDEIKDLPPRFRRYYGTFSILSTSLLSDTNGKTHKLYKLNSLNYTDSRSDFENIVVLKRGDYLEVNSDPVYTRYRVEEVFNDTNSVELVRVEGSQKLYVGENILKISSTQDTVTNVEIPVGFDEREVIFIKPIDPDSNIPATKWSPGIGFYSNDLTYIDGAGNTQTLQKFYQKNVVDFGQVLLSYANDYYPSIREGITPNPPRLEYLNGEGSFKIVQINQQLTEGNNTIDFKSKVANKVKLSSEITTISREIQDKKVAIQTTQYVSNNDKLKDQQSLNAMIKEHENKIMDYSNIVNSLKASYMDGPVVKPKYRVRGFWEIPDSKISPSSGEQKIIRFKIRYRYLSDSGNTNRESEMTYGSGTGVKTGKFSNWTEVYSNTRERVKTRTGYEWAAVDTSDPDAVNINQLDIPIQNGEQVEIQVKSISEAGWPANPLESEWSQPIVISFNDFPELAENDLTELIEQNNIDAAVAAATSSLKTASEHMSQSFYTNDKYFAHTAEQITSGFLTEEQTPITLYNKLQDLQSQITYLVEQVNNLKGDIIVSLIDNSDTSKVTILKEGVTTYINAGNYTSEIQNIDESQKNGAIVNKTYFIDIKSTTKSGLFLLSKLSGNRLSMCPSTISTDHGVVNKDGNCVSNNYEQYDNVILKTHSSSTYYKEMGRYDLVPINLTNSEFLDFQVASPNMYQSAQCRGQFIYSRFRNIGDTFDMYANDMDEKTGYGIFNETSDFSKSEINYKFVYNNGYYGTDTLDSLPKIIKEYNSITASNINPTDVINDSVEKETKLIKILNRLPKTWKKIESAISNRVTDKRLQLRSSNLTAESIDDVIATSMKSLTRLKSIKNSGSLYAIEPKLQSTYGFTDLGKLYKADFDSPDGDRDDGSFITTHKIGYEEKDRYAVGEDTCNSFLFLSPVTHTDIQVKSDNENSSIELTSTSSIRVPLIYQYRMTDYAGNIFGDVKMTSNNSVVKNTKYANIIGIDIWSNVSEEKPKQYDIIVYSSYDGTSDVTHEMNISTQQIFNTQTEMTNAIKTKIEQAQATTSVVDIR